MELVMDILGLLDKLILIIMIGVGYTKIAKWYGKDWYRSYFWLAVLAICVIYGRLDFAAEAVRP